MTPDPSPGRSCVACVRRVYHWGPAIFWMAGIFYFSSQPNPLNFLPARGQRGAIDKVAHVAEYAGLLLLLYRAVSRREGESENGRWTMGEDGRSIFDSPSSVFVSFVVALVYAFFDEVHQELVPGRRFQLADVGYDLAGMLAALGVIWMREEIGRWKGISRQEKR